MTKLSAILNSECVEHSGVFALTEKEIKVDNDSAI